MKRLLVALPLALAVVAIGIASYTVGQASALRSDVRDLERTSQTAPTETVDPADFDDLRTLVGDVSDETHDLDVRLGALESEPRQSSADVSIVASDLSTLARQWQTFRRCLDNVKLHQGLGTPNAYPSDVYDC